MEQPLDNPVWHALIGPHAEFAIGHGAARHYPRDIVPFAGIADATPAAYADLASFLPPGLEARLFRADRRSPPDGWAEVSARPIAQMVATEVPILTGEGEVVALARDDLPSMMALAAHAQPGPFADRTPQLGRFVGIKRGGELLAMAGERLRLPGWVELSAICVHARARGMGLGAAVTARLARAALDRGERPFLHVFPDNPAMKLYGRLGFRERARLWVLWHRPAPA